MTESQRWFFLILALVAGGLVYLLSPILSPFLIGALLAYLADPVADRLEDAGLSRAVSVIIVFIAMSALVFMLFLLFIPKLGLQIVLIFTIWMNDFFQSEQQRLSWVVIRSKKI